jgi:hypothetical protein
MYSFITELPDYHLTKISPELSLQILTLIDENSNFVWIALNVSDIYIFFLMQCFRHPGTVFGILVCIFVALQNEKLTLIALSILMEV